MSYSPARPDEILQIRHYAISTFGRESATWMAVQLSGGPSSAAWPLANLALYVPFFVAETVIVYEAGTGMGATAGGNFDIGIYDMAGTKLVSSGTTARTVSVWNTAGLTDTTLTPGWYYAAMSTDGTNNYSGYTGLSAGIVEALGVCEQQTAFVLPSTATLTRTTRTLIPGITFAVRSVAI